MGFIFLIFSIMSLLDKVEWYLGAPIEMYLYFIWGGIGILMIFLFPVLISLLFKRLVDIKPSNSKLWEKSKILMVCILPSIIWTIFTFILVSYEMGGESTYHVMIYGLYFIFPISIIFAFLDKKGKNIEK